jgi:hypothetical protein
LVTPRAPWLSYHRMFDALVAEFKRLNLPDPEAHARKVVNRALSPKAREQVERSGK